MNINDPNTGVKLQVIENQSLGIFSTKYGCNCDNRH